MTDDRPICDGDPLARQLAGLTPAPAAFTRDQLMFAAGAASRDPDVRFWKRLAAFQPVGLAAVVFGLFLLPEGAGRGGVANGPPSAEPTQRYMAEHTPPAAPPREPLLPVSEAADPAARAKLLQLRADVFAAGLNVLPSPAGPPPAAEPDKLEKDLHLPRGLFAVPGRPMPPPE